MTKSDDEKKKEKTETARDERGTNAIEARRVSAFGKRGQRRVRGLVAGGRRPVRGRRVSRMVSRSKNLPAPPPHPPRRGTAQILLTPLGVRSERGRVEIRVDVARVRSCP
jgi:hypothetical protein